MEERWLSVDEVALYLGVKRDFRGMAYGDLHRLQLDLECTPLGPSSRTQRLLLRFCL